MNILKNNLVQRIITIAILAPIIFVLLMLTDVTFVRILDNIIILIAFSLALKEWVQITASSKKKVFWWLFGTVYILSPVYFCYQILSLGNIGHAPSGLILIVVLAAVWATDIGGYVFGKTIGGPKLAPKISPNKTWAGAIGGLVLTILVLDNVGIGPNKGFLFYLLISLFSVIAQLGDLFESWVKRKFKVKDSGSILPGHGGMLDRLDSLIAALWYTFIIMKYQGL